MPPVAPALKHIQLVLHNAEDALQTDLIPYLTTERYANLL